MCNRLLPPLSPLLLRTPTTASTRSSATVDARGRAETGEAEAEAAVSGVAGEVVAMAVVVVAAAWATGEVAGPRSLKCPWAQPPGMTRFLALGP